MAPHYVFDDRKVSFQKNKKTWKGIVFNVLKYFFLSVAFAVVYYVVFALLFSTDTERRLRQENRMYSKLWPEMQRKDDLLHDVIDGLRLRDNAIYNDIFHTDAPDLELYSGLDLLMVSDTVADDDIVKMTAARLSELERRSDIVEANLLEALSTLAGNADEASSPLTGNEYATLPPMHVPLKDYSYSQTGATVGSRINPFYKVAMEHKGLDMLAASGTPVYASGRGVVSGISRSRKGDGNVVEITHEGGYITRYAHLEEILVPRGRRVDTGTMIGRVGMSGTSFAPHLHYEMYRDSVLLNPVNYFFGSLDQKQYIDVLVMSAVTRQSMD